MNQLTNIPERKPDELFATYVDRLAFANGFKSTQEMIKEVFEEKGLLSSVYFNRNSRSLYRNEALYPKITAVLNRQFDLDYFKDSMIYTAIAPFLKQGSQTSIINSLFSRGIKNRKNLIFNYVAFLNELKFCSECMKEEIELFGYHIYHTSHQFPGVHMCLKHKVRLRQLDTVCCDEYDDPINKSSKCHRNGTDEVMLEYAEAAEKSRQAFPPSNSDINIKINNEEIVLTDGKKMSIEKKRLIKEIKESKYGGILTPHSDNILNYSRSFSRDTLASMIAGILFMHHSIDNYLSKIPQCDTQGHIERLKKKGFDVIGLYHPALACFKCTVCGEIFIGTYQGLCDGFECPKCQSSMNEDQLAKLIVHNSSKGTYELINSFHTMYEHSNFYDEKNNRYVSCPLYYFIYFDGRDLTRKYTDEDCRRAIDKTKDFEFIRRLSGHSFEVRHKGCGGTFTIKSMKRFTEVNTYCHVCGAGRRKRTNYTKGKKSK